MNAPRGCTNLKLRQLTRLATSHYESFLGATGLKITQYSLLSFVVRLAPMRAGDLAAAMKLSASALSRSLQPLVQLGLVTVSPGADARSRIIDATVAGHATREAAAREWKRAQLALNERLGAERVAALHQLLDDCIAVLGDAKPKDES